jgi:hypothetical protein
MEMSRCQLRGRINLSRLSVLRHAPLRMETYTPIGERFSHVYVQRGEPTQDSPRMHRRLAELLKDFPDLDDFGETLHSRSRCGQSQYRGHSCCVNWFTSDS